MRERERGAPAVFTGGRVPLHLVSCINLVAGPGERRGSEGGKQIECLLTQERVNHPAATRRPAGRRTLPAVYRK